MDALRKAYPDRVPILLANGVPYLWESRDVEYVRTQHNLCGLLSGTLALIPQQNVFLGLPLRLLPEEVVLLLRRRAAVLIDENHAYETCKDSEREHYLADEAQKILEQKEEQRQQQEEHRQRIEAAINQETGDARALERRRARQAAKEAREASQGTNETVPREPDALAKMPYVHHTPGTSAEIPGYHPATADMQQSSVNAYTTLRDAQSAGVWTYPRTLQERARCATFEALHSKGFFLSTGLRFGGDFVVYPGDPLRYHSHYTATILATPEQPMAAFHIVASGRLGTAVKKSHLLCQANTVILDDAEALERRLAGYDDASDASPAPPWGQVEYWSLAWAGFGT